ncbi:MAG: hypothetical protein AAF682_12850 [Planctomycetota bacterium]
MLDRLGSSNSPLKSVSALGVALLLVGSSVPEPDNEVPHFGVLGSPEYTLKHDRLEVRLPRTDYDAAYCVVAQLDGGGPVVVLNLGSWPSLAERTVHLSLGGLAHALEGVRVSVVEVSVAGAIQSDSAPLPEPEECGGDQTEPPTLPIVR